MEQEGTEVEGVCAQQVLGATQGVLEMEQRELVNSATRSVRNPLRESVSIENYIRNITKNEAVIEQSIPAFEYSKIYLVAHHWGDIRKCPMFNIFLYFDYFPKTFSC